MAKECKDCGTITSDKTIICERCRSPFFKQVEIKTVPEISEVLEKAELPKDIFDKTEDDLLKSSEETEEKETENE